MLTKVKDFLGIGEQTNGHVPVLWMDDTEWDLAELPKEEVPFDARAADFDGEWTYVLERKRIEHITTDEKTGEVIKTETETRYEPYPLKLALSVNEITQQDLYDATDMIDYANFLKAEPLDIEKISKVFMYVFICGILFFGFLVTICLLG